MMMSTASRGYALETDCHLLNAEEKSAFFSKGYSEVYDDVMAAVPYDSWLDYLEDIACKFGCRMAKILDAACGTGTFAMLALDRGMEVTGVDASPLMLQHLKH